VTGYIVERCEGKSTRWTKVRKDAVTQRQLEVDDLLAGETYQVDFVHSLSIIGLYQHGFSIKLHAGYRVCAYALRDLYSLCLFS